MQPFSIRSGVHLVRLLAVALVAASLTACNSGSRSDGSTSSGVTPSTGTSAPASTATPAPGAPAPTAPAPSGTQVGSRFWHEGDDFANPLERHNASEAAFAQQVLDLTNQERAANGLGPLQHDPEAERAAKAHCEDMDGRGFFDHFTPEGWSPHDRLIMLGADPAALLASGENIAFGQQTPAEVVQAWMNSPGHRANILYPGFTHLGVGVAEARPYWAQVFTTR